MHHLLIINQPQRLNNGMFQCWVNHLPFWLMEQKRENKNGNQNSEGIPKINGINGEMRLDSSDKVVGWAYRKTGIKSL